MSLVWSHLYLEVVVDDSEDEIQAGALEEVDKHFVRIGAECNWVSTFHGLSYPAAGQMFRHRQRLQLIYLLHMPCIRFLSLL